MTKKMAEFKVVQVIRDGNEMLDWVPQRLKEAGIDFSMHECWTGEDLTRWAVDADLVWSYGGSCAPDLLKGDRLKLLKRCGAIVRTGSGTDNVDIETATHLGIIVANTPQAVTESLSDHSIALVFSLVRQIPPQDRLVRAGQWNYRLAPPGRRLTGATWGLVGFGRGPRRMVEKLRGFKMNFLVYDPFVSSDVFDSYAVQAASLEELFRTSDFVSLHCPLTKETFHLVGERELGWLQPHALLVNTSRGAVIDEPALIHALQAGRLAGAALDVFEQEPVSADNPLFKLANVVATPHISGYDDSHPRPGLEATVEAIIDLSQHRWPYSYVNPGVVPRWGSMLPRREG